MDMLNKINSLSVSASKVVLKINHSKTTSMMVGTTQASFSVNCHPIKRVDQLIYLRNVNTADGRARSYIKTRIRKAQTINLKTKLRLFETNSKKD